MNFKILKVNGEDFSDATHQQAVAAFENAEEPITVVLSRSQNINKFVPRTPERYVKVDSGTQTEQTCFCEATKCDASSSLSALMRFHSLLNATHEDHTAPMHTTHEIILRRESSHEKLGLTLYNDTGCEDTAVVVKEVQANSIAARYKSVQNGDRILKINGCFVQDMHEARSMLQSDTLEVKLTLARYSQTVEEEQCWSDEGVSYDDNEDLLSEVLDAEETVEDHQEYTLDSVHDFSLSRFTNTNSKDSGLGRTDESTVNSENGTLGSMATFKHENKSCFKAYHKHSSGRRSIESVDSAKGSIESTSLSPISPQSFTYDKKEEKLQCVSENDDKRPQRTTNFENLHSIDDAYTPWICKVDQTTHDVFYDNYISDKCSSAYNTNESKPKLPTLTLGRTDCCISSDCNSDPDDSPLCYLTHDEQNADSEGFQDASVDFTSSVVPQPYPRRKSDVIKPTVPQKQKLSRSSSAPNPASGSSGLRKSAFETLAEVDESAENIKQAEMNAMMERMQCKDKRKIANKSRKTKVSTDCGTDSSSSKLEWKVKIRSDGSRYITKRPVRERLMKEREMKVNKERCGITTDDDALTELKLGKHWSRDDRKRHLEKAKEQKRRKAFMEKCRNELMKDASNNEGDIVKLSNKKMIRRKNKTMFDDFITVQEILTHGNRFINDDNSHPLLSVTYI